MRKLSKIITLFLIVTAAACMNFKNQVGEITINGFDNKEWKQDSIGCNKKRNTLAKVLVDNKKQLLDKQKEEINNFLGLPNFVNTEGSTYFYFIESGPQCMYVDKNGYDSLEVKKLLIDFDKDKVKDVYTILP